jgi:hypothetical protein
MAAKFIKSCNKIGVGYDYGIKGKIKDRDVAPK